MDRTNINTIFISIRININTQYEEGGRKGGGARGWVGGGAGVVLARRVGNTELGDTELEKL